jgi:ubiquinol-cytochrome c reductase cytochrome b subunit
VRSRFGRLVDWIDARTGWRALRAHLLDEPIPAGTGWWFTTGSVVLFLLGVQLATGVVLTFYYVPSSASAYDSVRYVMEQVTFGRVLRGLHFFGASFIVIAAVVHLLRVVVSGSYKKPREVTWISGMLLLLVILAFALTGYLLPWDQKAYWATTVTINIARGGPFGEYVASVLRGGPTLGALTLLRWYSAHVFLLPAALFVLTAAHLALMRRHGISGPVRPRALPSTPFYPYHALKDTIVIAAVFALLVTLAATIRAPLDSIADPTNASYVPRPEWYFMSLFQLLKYFPGRLEPVATIVVPGIVVGGLLALPFLDRRPERHPRQRMAVMAAFAVLGAGVSTLTYLGMHDAPAATHNDAQQWNALAIAGQEFARDERCMKCHRAGGVANILDETRMRKEPRWTLAHVRDPEMIAPGSRPAPPGSMSEAQAQSILSFMREVSAGDGRPVVNGQERTAALVLGRYCATCHMIDGAGSSTAPDLSNVGARHDAAWLKMWITDPESVDGFASMPPFGQTLTPQQLDAVVNYLASRK